jgi:hypothetical protein
MYSISVATFTTYALMVVSIVAGIALLIYGLRGFFSKEKDSMSERGA